MESAPYSSWNSFSLPDIDYNLHNKKYAGKYIRLVSNFKAKLQGYTWMNKLEYKDIPEVMGDYDAFLFDLWGVIVEGENIYDGVIETINRVISSGKHCFFVSNAPRPAEDSFRRIQSWGIEV